jgi:uncharacterized protein (DUF1800 family)
MRGVCLVALLAVTIAGCAPRLRPGSRALQHPDRGTVVHVLNRLTFGPRPGDADRVQRMGLAAYIAGQLHPQAIDDAPLDARLASLTGLALSSRAFATDYYLPMVAARQVFTDTQKTGATAALPRLGWHLQPIAALSLPGGDKPVSVLQQSGVTPDELRYQRENQAVLDALQGQKLLRAVYSERQLQEVLTDFWFNHFNVDVRKIDDHPVMIEYERDVVRPHVLGRFRDLLGATAKSPAMLFYLDNWLSKDRGLNENYARELMELHTLGVDGGYTQADVVNVARAFTGWTMRKPHEATGFEFNDKMHDHNAKRVLGQTIKAGGGVEDGEQVLDLLARHPATARFIAAKLVRRFVQDDPPPALVDRAAKTFRRTDGDLREVVRTILTSPEFLAPAARRAKVKAPFEYVASLLRATRASVTNVRSLVGTIGAMGEPLYQCQPPTGYADRSSFWMNTGALIGRLNFAQSLAANGASASTLDVPRAAGDVGVWADGVLGGDLSAPTRAVLQSTGATAAVRIGLLLGSPEFQRR